MNTLREYRKELLLYCLQLEYPVSASQLSYTMGRVSRQELHPRTCWDSINPHHVAHLVKELVIERKVMQSPIPARNLNGRPESRWEPALKCDIRPLPSPPEDQEMYATPSSCDDPEVESPSPVSPENTTATDTPFMARLRSLRRQLDELEEEYERECKAPSPGRNRRLP